MNNPAASPFMTITPHEGPEPDGMMLQNSMLSWPYLRAGAHLLYHQLTIKRATPGGTQQRGGSATRPAGVRASGV